MALFWNAVCLDKPNLELREVMNAMSILCGFCIPKQTASLMFIIFFYAGTLQSLHMGILHYVNCCQLL